MESEEQEQPINNCIHLRVNSKLIKNFCNKAHMICPNKIHACEWYRNPEGQSYFEYQVMAISQDGD